mmetsp:Transcript_34588/g.81948  ORF Transcript_34588/g.81948 Transcript_34588/m.81948 type:complete len:205 (+) Transcript_34588:887-1501(+)
MLKGSVDDPWREMPPGDAAMSERSSRAMYGVTDVPCRKSWITLLRFASARGGENSVRDGDPTQLPGVEGAEIGRSIGAPGEARGRNPLRRCSARSAVGETTSTESAFTPAAGVPPYSDRNAPGMVPSDTAQSHERGAAALFARALSSAPGGVEGRCWAAGVAWASARFETNRHTSEAAGRCRGSCERHRWRVDAISEYSCGRGV